MRLALYGGTFDPIHHGHLILARDAIELLELDRVIFIPAAISPHKPGATPAPGEQRAGMIRAAIADEPRLEIDECELHRPGPSFTIDTAEQWRGRFPTAEIFYLIGRDNVPELHTWRRIEELRRLVQLMVLDRGEAGADHGLPSLPRRIDISATEVRARVARRESVQYLVPEPVRALIARHHLYQEPRH